MAKVKEKYKFAFSNAGAFAVGCAFWAVVPGFFVSQSVAKETAPVTVSALTVIGTVSFGADYLVSLSDGSSVRVQSAQLVDDAKGRRFKHADAWIYLKAQS